VIVFWAASAPRSTALLEDFREYQERWGREDLAIVAVHAGGADAGARGPAEVRDLADRMNVVFPVLLDSERIALTAYGVREFPTVVVIDASGRVSSVLGGSSARVGSELEGHLLVAMGRGPDYAVKPSPASCTIPRARSCTRIDERDPSASDPAVLAVRLCVCHGDADAAQLMLTGVSKQGLLGLDLRFALAHMMLVKGRTADARRAFDALRERYPREGWGEWGLGIVALAEGDADAALGHLRAAREGGWSIPEAETAVLKYLELYWRTNRAAPREEQFLALFEDLGSVRECYRTLNTRG
jgi:hypothetical protein